MVNLLIDANVFRAIYEEDIGLEAPRPERSAPATPILNQNARPSKIFVDKAENSQIEAEWRKQCRNNSEWFEAWLAEQYRTGSLWTVDIETKHRSSADKIFPVGFPALSHDIWYIRVAYAAKDARPTFPVYLISEDIDFYDPTHKASTNKLQKFIKGNGPVVKHLKKNHIYVRCIQTYLRDFP